ncbi:MAG: glycosyltransferase [Paramuribaculum sp.]|nr:glycosyltransferase [Paramuribaculum sp.]
MNNSPIISIITPVFNTERYLPQCIESIISQTFTDWELILVDDGSTDSSGKICDDYAARDNRIRVIHKSNSGVADSRNIAITEAKGEFLGFVDADDWIEPEMYQVLYDDITAHKADVAIGGYWFDWTNMERPRQKDTEIFSVLDRSESIRLTYEDRLIQSIFCDKLWRRQMANAPLPKGYFYEDFATVIKWMANAECVTLRTKPYYHYRMRRGSTVNGVHPDRRYHYLLAEIERAKYLESIGFNPQHGYAPRVLHTAVTAAKLIARGVEKRDEAIHYIAVICKTIEPYLPADKESLDHKTYKRLQRMLNNPRRFVNAVRFSRLFMWAGKRKEKNLYP